MSIAAVIITKNEERVIADCIRSVQWMDEIVVIDDQSTDRTVEIARELGGKVWVQPMEDFAQQRNAGIDLSTSEWLLHLDADMVVSEDVKQEIERVVADSPREAYGVQFNNYWLGRHMRHGGWNHSPILKLARRRIRFSGEVHEKLDAAGPVGSLENRMDHFTDTHYRARLMKSSDYSQRTARTWYGQGKRFRLLPFLLTPWIRGLTVYLLRGGVRDGLVGFMWFIHVVFGTYAQHIMLWELGRDDRD